MKFIKCPRCVGGSLHKNCQVCKGNGYIREQKNPTQAEWIEQNKKNEKTK